MKRARVVEFENIICNWALKLNQFGLYNEKRVLGFKIIVGMGYFQKSFKFLFDPPLMTIVEFILHLKQYFRRRNTVRENSSFSYYLI